jgi:hypothetical protein
MRFPLADGTKRDDARDLFLSRRCQLVFPVVNGLRTDAQELRELGGGKSKAFPQRDQALCNETR